MLERSTSDMIIDRCAGLIHIGSRPISIASMHHKAKGIESRSSHRSNFNHIDRLVSQCSVKLLNLRAVNVIVNL